MVETTIGLYKTEAITTPSPFRTGPLRDLADVEHLTDKWVNWYNTTRLHTRLGYLPPDEHEAAYYDQHTNPPHPGEKPA